MNNSNQISIQVEPTEFTNLVVGAALDNGLPSVQAMSFRSQHANPMVVIACAPKSGSTFLSHALSRITNLPSSRLSSAYATNEHDLYLPALYIMSGTGCVSQMHMKGTFHNAALARMFGIKPIILVRNIEDTVVSLLDDLRAKERRDNFGSGEVGFSFLWQDDAIASLNETALIDCIIDLAVPWYVNFYVSWYRLCERHDIEALWITYEELMGDKRGTVQNILGFLGFGAGFNFNDEVLDQHYAKFNKGGSGRGTVILSEGQKARIKRLFSYYSDIDFSKYGLENKKSSPHVDGDLENKPSSDDLVDLGEAHHKVGRLQEAESCYRQALKVDPGHPGALYFLANIAYEDNRLLYAKQLIDTLLKENQDDAEAWHLLGMLAIKLDDLQKASDCLKRAIEIEPTYAQAYYGLGGVLAQQGNIDEALASFERAVSINPQFGEAHFAIGNILRGQGKLDSAVSSYRAAIAVKPAFELAYQGIGEILLSQGKWDEALLMYRKGIVETPHNAQLHAGIGSVYLLKKQNDEAAASFERALALDPNCTLAQGNLGVILFDQNKISEAQAAFRRAIELNPQDPRSWFNLGKTLHKSGQLIEAIDCFEKAVAINPDYVEAQSYLLFLHSYLPGYSKNKLFAEHVAFGERFEASLRSSWPHFDKSRVAQRRLRVGFVSGDLLGHPVGYFLEGVLRELRELNGIDIVVYSVNPKADAITERLRALPHTWSSVFDLSDEALAQRIQDDKIDILVDLSGHTGFSRLLVFARKPAPIQVTWLGYWDTTGLQAMDYILCDRFGVHEGDEKYFVEKPWYLPHTRLCFTMPNGAIEIASLPAHKNNFITFGCFNNLTKMTDRVVCVWSRILQSVPRSKLFLKSGSLSDSFVRQSVVERFVAEGVSSDRLELESSSPRREYLAAYNRVDIALDPFPFPGGTTSVEGIWMGVPMITLSGDRIISRQGESILHNVGLQDWIARNEDEYVALAVKKATNVTELAELRRGLRGRLESSPLCDAKLFAQNLQDAFMRMWKIYSE